MTNCYNLQFTPLSQSLITLSLSSSSSPIEPAPKSSDSTEAIRPGVLRCIVTAPLCAVPMALIDEQTPNCPQSHESRIREHRKKNEATEIADLTLRQEREN